MSDCIFRILSSLNSNMYFLPILHTVHSNILDIYAAINSKQMQSASCFDCPWDSRLVDTTIGMHLYRDIGTFYCSLYLYLIWFTRFNFSKYRRFSSISIFLVLVGVE